jgi:hypothetical protein
MWITNAQVPIPGTKLNANLAWGFGPGNISALGAQFAAYVHGDQTASEMAGNMATITAEMFIPLKPSHMSPAKDFWKWLVDTVAPSLVRPPLELAMNKDSIGNEIYNAHANRYSGVYTGGANVPQYIKDAATYMHQQFETELSPNEMYFLISNYGEAVNDATNMAYETRLAMTGQKEPDWKSFFGGLMSRDSNVDSRHYAEIKDEVTKATHRLHEIEIDPESGSRLREKHPFDTAITASFNKNLGTITGLQAEMNRVRLQPIPLMEKKQILDALGLQLNIQKRMAVEATQPVTVEASR